MDVTFWVGLLVGGILSLIGSIIANLYNQKINLFLENRRFKLSNRRKTQEIKEFQTITALRNGERDKTLFFLARVFRIIVGCSCAALGMVMSLEIGIYKILLVINSRPSSFEPHIFTAFQIVTTLGQMVPLLAAFIGLFVMHKSSREFFDYWRKLDWYDDYARARTHKIVGDLKGV